LRQLCVKSVAPQCLRRLRDRHLRWPPCTQEHGACGGAGAVDFDALARRLQRPIFGKVGANLSAGIVCDPHSRGCRRKPSTSRIDAKAAPVLINLAPSLFTHIWREGLVAHSLMRVLSKAHCWSSGRLFCPAFPQVVAVNGYGVLLNLDAGFGHECGQRKEPLARMARQAFISLPSQATWAD
jgi:hypothetical protein